MAPDPGEVGPLGGPDRNPLLGNADSGAEPHPQPAPDPLEKAATARADKLLQSGFRGWWAGADSEQRTAYRVLVGAALVGPVGTGVFSLLKGLTNPTLSTQIIRSWGWLLLITLPVAAAAVAGMFFGGRMHPMGLLSLLALIAFVSVLALQSVKAPTQLGDLYCYASISSDGAVYERQCRDMDTEGFVSDSLSRSRGAKGSLETLGAAYVLVSDARGSLMALCGLFGGLAGGYLLRRQST
ncbi:hypothetical protein AB0M43_00135 [Longispora sp. NPDC051575]|uniref:hypothetical protein n=1 Tax=Longispora sp. NPDC051575 TaxID=3154943 RepID=UPI00343EE5CD